MDEGVIRSSMRALVLIAVLTLELSGGTKHYFDKPVFVFAQHPDLPISEYVKGRLGIPEPGHARIYLYAAYRYLENRPFTGAEQTAFLRVWELRKDRLVEDPDHSGEEAWTRMRDTVPVPIQQPHVTPSLAFTRGFTARSICADDAFRSAVTTLKARIRQFGLRSAAVEFWVKGQDLVFDSCDPAHTRLPEPAPANLPAVIRADREYQIAAALFYLQRFDEALARFRSIAQDHDSPWRIWAPYMIGRTLLWQARLTQDDNTYMQRLREAETQFRGVLADHSLAITHQAAERLL